MDNELASYVGSISRKISNTIILRKGLVDIITDGRQAFYVKTQGSLKRCGGQGDVLAGMLGTFTYYANLLKDQDNTFEIRQRK